MLFGESPVPIPGCQIVEGESHAKGRAAVRSSAVGRHQDRKRFNQVRCNAEQGGALADGLAHPGQIAAGEVPEAPVYDPQAVRRGLSAEVSALEDGHP